jgi:hypothetical protein
VGIRGVSGGVLPEKSPLFQICISRVITLPYISSEAAEARIRGQREDTTQEKYWFSTATAGSRRGVGITHRQLSGSRRGPRGVGKAAEGSARSDGGLRLRGQPSDGFRRFRRRRRGLRGLPLLRCVTEKWDAGTGRSVTDKSTSFKLPLPTRQDTVP